MKKFFALLSCIPLLVAAGCGKGSIEKTKKQIIGEWSCKSLGGKLVFDDRERLRLRIDISDILTIDSGGTVHIMGNEADLSGDCAYDGSTFTFAMGKDGSVENMLTMTRKDGTSDDIFGEYTIDSGVIYDGLAEKYGEGASRFGAIVSEGSFEAEVELCGYSWDGKVMTFTGSDLTVFGVNEETVEYEMIPEDNCMTLKNSSETIELFKLR